MLGSKQNKYLKKVRFVVYLQLSLGSLSTIAALIVTYSLNSTFSGFLGMLVAVVPTLVYIKFAFGKGLHQLPLDVWKNHKRAMQYKFITTLLVFASIFFLYRNCNFLVLFAVYIITSLANWLALIRN